jgi:hypothetical protein
MVNRHPQMPRTRRHSPLDLPPAHFPFWYDFGESRNHQLLFGPECDCIHPPKVVILGTRGFALTETVLRNQEGAVE